MSSVKTSKGVKGMLLGFVTFLFGLGMSAVSTGYVDIGIVLFIITGIIVSIVMIADIPEADFPKQLEFIKRDIDELLKQKDIITEIGNYLPAIEKIIEAIVKEGEKKGIKINSPEFEQFIIKLLEEVFSSLKTS